MLQTSSQGRYPVLFTFNALPKPFMAALLVIGLRALLGTLVEIIPSFPGTQPLCS